MAIVRIRPDNCFGTWRHSRAAAERVLRAVRHQRLVLSRRRSSPIGGSTIRTGLGIPTDFVNVWAAGKLVLEGHPALAYDWDIQKQIEVAELGQGFIGHFAWHYPPPFLFVASLAGAVSLCGRFRRLGRWSASCLISP